MIDGSLQYLPCVVVNWQQPGLDWTRTAQIATPYDYPPGTFDTWEEAVDQAVADGANVLIDWHAVSDYWKALYDPLLSEDLSEMEYHANYIHTHYPGVRYIIYVAPLEYVTEGVDENRDGQVDPGKEAESLALQHPDWLQVGIDGRKAVFYGSYPGMPFWVCETCEDVWLTPANPEYRALALEQARRIAATGIDGVWFDVPFLRFDFGDNWQNQWPTFDPWARAQFQAETGYTLPEPPVAGWPNWNDPAWRAFIKWRYTLTSRFINDYRAALQQGNPNIKLIIETSVGPDVSATQQGSSTLDLPGVSDLTAHEHEGPWRSVDFHYYMWLRFLADLLFWHHTDGDQPSWLLSYVKAGEPDTVDVARLHAAIVLSAGMNYYTSGNETMSGIPEKNFRRQFFAWLSAQDATYYDPGWQPYANVALVYSQQTLDFLDRGSWESDLAYHDGFPGMAMMLFESHIPFEVLSERELARLSDYELAILPLFAAMSSAQAQAIRDYVASGGKIIATGLASLYDEEGVQLADFQLADVFGVHYSQIQPGQVYVNSYGLGRSVFIYSLEPGYILTHELDYFWSAEPWEGGVPNPAGAEQARQAFLNELWSQAQVEPMLSTTAPKGVILLPYRNGDKLAVRALNFQGVNYGDAVPTLTTVDLTLKLPSGLSPVTARGLEFLGGWQSQHFSQPDAQHIQMSFALSVHRVAELGLGTATLPPIGFLHVQGQNIVDADGRPVHLRGINMDTYYYSYLWNPNAPWEYAARQDIQYLKDLGATAIRLGLHWRYFDTSLGFDLIDTYLEWCEQTGIYVILDMHVVPPEDDILEGEIWNDPAAQQRFLDLWRAIATRYADRAVVAGYDTYNEPQPPDEAQWWDLARRAVAAIRSVDTRHIIFIEAPLLETVEPFQVISDSNVVYSYHEYSPFVVSHAGADWVGDTPVPDDYSYPGPVLVDVEWADWAPDATEFYGRTDDWLYWDSGTLTVPSNVEFATIKLFAHGDAGEVWFDDLELEHNGFPQTLFNPGAEEASQLDETRPSAWGFWSDSGFTGEWDCTTAHSGSCSLKIISDGEGFGVWTQDNWVLTEPLFRVRAGDTLRVRGWIRAPANNGGVSVTVDYLNGVYEEYDRTRLQAELQPYIDWAVTHNVPLYVGEFGCMSSAPSDSRSNLIADMISLLNGAHLHWTLWTYRDPGAPGFGLYHGNDLDERLDTILRQGLCAGLNCHVYLPVVVANWRWPRPTLASLNAGG